jgi:hypothetical protein
MLKQELTTELLNDWIEAETMHIDVIASWESLYDTYVSMRFTDHLSDDERLDEFKWIVQQMNSFLTKMRSKLLTCKDAEAIVELLRKNYTPSGKMELSTRKALVYQKLRQQWIRTKILVMETAIEDETEEEQDGWTE